ncbi:helix-turn-helix domain-containing protein [Arthrobacter woluwensis]|uniref:helix-turn-helix domain-containing protein n=1 Tax=Arthrobacter woluwensis TaxID=156980 RepID=UPI0037F262F1
MSSNSRHFGPFAQAVADELRGAVSRARMTQGELSKRTGLGAPTISKTLNGVRVADVEDVRRIAGALGLSANEIIAAAEALATRPAPVRRTNESILAPE